ncbi:protein arginine methyltransferase NDUFAF7, mitochondrial [Petromyzon marinus]|uniref:Protein arginine methyltransferase NDUFAF7 n=1 Tax=Petromyzon marinus TaxID=7757 RepID=A0AAJ7X2Q7_PETMA|nr:protein arginine methyltransferase NDUFAF7, mitochondrial [Petromyzon marinus]
MSAVMRRSLFDARRLYRRQLRGLGLLETRKDVERFSSTHPESGVEVTPMLKHLVSKIKATGPISTAEYMREVLTNPAKGYYIHHDMLGERGDFVTSPEISQIFGELVAVWCVSEWVVAGRPPSLRLVELGPGRGSLASDMLRVVEQLRQVLDKTEVALNLVEVSSTLSEVQEQVLIGTTQDQQTNLDSHTQRESSTYKQRVTRSGIPVCWHRNLQDVPEGFTFFVAHEFFDALPIHTFKKTERGWREVMVDIDPELPFGLRFVMAPTPSLASSALVQAGEVREHVEVCPEAAVLVANLAKRVAAHGGGALIADYGHEGTGTDTFRGFRGHKPHHVLCAPGLADLTADVDFAYLRRAGEGHDVTCLGPIAQRDFLQNMGIDLRLKILLRNAGDPETRQRLLAGYEMLMSPEKMGTRFKFFSLVPSARLLPGPTQESTKSPAPPPVPGFSELVMK